MMTRKTIPERLDDSVRWTGIPSALEVFERQDDSQRRHLRWLPLLLLVAYSAGAGMMLFGERPQIVGPLVAWFGFLGSAFMPIFGPVKAWGSLTLDEYDRDVRRRAFLFAYAACTMFAMAAFIGIAAIVAPGTQEPRRIVHALLLSPGAILTMQATLPTLYTSWRTRPVEGE
ncbi:hypothetical protein [Sphingomonas sp. AX6]|uniref:hypothetical protein n=1 Tax=Sphingomonas sp. AX6 TaxID=2653171 RepID=UPI0012EFD560|nr:hypothetical protein [Sphingomonas sp. AX6]VXC79626.1 conserved membrane hypothetical protein [Sphingomonas sp. AX6]